MGVDASATPPGDGVDDPHYLIISQSSPGGSVDTSVPSDGFSIPTWFANDANSRWFGVKSNNDSDGPAGSYTDRIAFTSLVDVVLPSVAISGLWRTDDPGVDVLINGFSVSPISVYFKSLTAP